MSERIRLAHGGGGTWMQQLIDAELRDDPGIYPTPEVKERLQPNLAKSAEYTRLLNRSWTRFTTGQ
mgnify:CR=1 FL=1